MRLDARPVLLAAGFLLGVAAPVLAESRLLEFTQQTRNANNEIVLTKRRIDPATTGVMVIDSWNYHWCMTCLLYTSPSPRDS